MKPVWGFIWMLIITLFLLTAYSFAPFTLHIGKIEIKKTHFAQFIMGDTTKIPSLAAQDIHWQRQSIDTTHKNILLFGDSMLEQLRYPMYDYCRYNGHKLHVVIWYAAKTSWVGNSDTLAYFIKKFKPNYVIIVLGANELPFKMTPLSQSKYMFHILKQLDTLPFVWIGPPNWRKDRGINNVIRYYVGNDRFFPSYKISLNNPKFTRFQDQAHPTYNAAYLWMDSIAPWIMYRSRYPIKLEKPPYRTHKNPPLVVLQPLKEE